MQAVFLTSGGAEANESAFKTARFYWKAKGRPDKVKIQGDVEQDYQRSLSVEDAMRPDVMLAWQMNGQPLLPQHGAPLRLIVPFRYGARSLKAITEISFTATTFAPPKSWLT